MRRRPPRLRLVAAAAVVASSVSALGAAAAPGTATAAGPLRVLASSAPPVLAPRTRIVGPLAPATAVRLGVTLAVRDPAGLQSLIVALHDPTSPQFHRFLTPRGFAARFGATAADLAAVESWLRSIGATVTSVAPDRLAIHATAAASAIATGLRTPLETVRTPTGRTAFTNRAAPAIPSSMAALVTGIVGLNSLPLAHTDLVRARPVRGARQPEPNATPDVRGPRACSGAKLAAESFGSFTAPGLANYYEMSPLYALGDLGAGIKVGIAEFEPNSATDISTFQSCYHTTAQVAYTAIDDGVAGSGVVTNDPGSGEAALDIENVIGLAPRATITVYQTPNTDLGDLDMYAQMVTDADKVISTSWGSCEPETTPAVITAEQTTFAEANVLGDAVFAAAGDSGSTDCFPHQDGFPPSDDSTLAVDDPGSQPYVFSVGGTTATAHGEVVWNDSSGGAGGGGISTAHCMPTYQDNPAVAGIVNAYSVQDLTTCPTGPSYLREVPDVSAVADPATGFTVFWAGGWGAIGGTSGSAPLWAAAAALVQASPYCKAFGAVSAVSPQAVYALAANHVEDKAALFDVTKGDNAVSASGYLGALYPARVGFDEASGLGTPSLTYFAGTSTPDLFHPGLASLLCYAARAAPVAPTVTRVVPRRVASGHPTNVTVVGTGFLAISGAERVAIDGKVLKASCTSSTRCDVTLPGLPSTTAHLRVLVQTYAKSPATAADLVTFVHTPRVTRISPHSGRPSGGTRVTIRGHGFTGAVVVYFGGVRATHVRVVSPTEILATAPRGAGRAYVTVRAIGGKSSRVAASIYRY